MAEIILGVLGPAIELGKCVAVPIKHQFNYFCCFNSNINSLKEEAKKLEEERAGLEMEVTTAENDLRVIDPKVVTWLKEVIEIQQNMSSLETEITNIQGCGCLSVKSRYSISRRSYKASEAMRQKREDRRDINFVSHHRPPPASMTTLGDEKRTTLEFESRKEIEENIMTTLRDGKVKIMGICGMGGVGKTTMANKVMSGARAEQLFDESMMVVVSQKADMEKIQADIAGNLGLMLEGRGLSSRAIELSSRLMGGKRILIILDDVWEDLKLEELGIPCKDGCSILLTSRDRGVFTKMDVKLILAMKTLTEDEALSFFKEKLRFCADDPNWISGLAQEIVKECKGLPLALASVVGVLKGQKNKSFWKDALQQLKSSNPEDLPGVLKDVYTPLKLSYDYLNSQNAKSIFLLCCIFPEDYNIPLKDLATYAMGLRMFGKMRNLEEVRNRTYSLVETLKSHFLLLEGRDERYVRMHDVVRDVAIFIASKERQLIKCGDNSVWISPFLGESIELSTGLTFPNIRLLLVDESADKELQISGIPFEGMNELNVLSITYTYYMCILPNTISFLKNLVTLILECDYLRTMRFVGELVNLEILICRRCYKVEELPSEIARLKCLKLLEISDCRRVQKIGPRVISSLDKLEELKIIKSFNKWEATDGQQENVNAGLGELESLSNLTRLEIQVLDSDLAAQEISLPRNIEKYHIEVGYTSERDYPREFGKIMNLHLQREINLGKWIHACVANAEYLILGGNGSNCVDLGEAQEVRRLLFINCSTASSIVKRCGATVVFPLLENMRLWGLDNLKEIICDIDAPISEVSSNYSLKNLKELTLEYLPKLKRLWKNPNVVSHYNNLSSIGVVKCERLVNLFPPLTAKDCFPQLESLIIHSCGMMEQIFSWNEEEEKEKEKNIAHESRGITITFPKLKILQLWDLQNLKVFYKGIESIEFPLLTQLFILGCPLFNGLVSNFDGNHSSQMFCKEKASFDNLRELPLIANAKINNTFTPQISMGSFPQLEQLQIYGQENIKSLCLFSIAQNLDSLKILEIMYCDKMVKVIEEEGEECSHETPLLFPHLEHLCLDNLPKLKMFCNWRCGLELPKLVNVFIKDCPEMESINLGSLTTPNMKCLQQLYICSSSMMEQVFWWSEEENAKEIIGQSSHTITFPKLKGLGLIDLPRLTNVFKGIDRIELPLLTEMAMLRCPNLEGPASEDVNNKVVKEQTIYCSLSLWDKFPTENFTGLEKLWIKGFDKISCLISTSIARNLTNLRDLRIGSCKNLVKVIEEEVNESHETTLLPHLEELYLDELPKLKIFCEWRCVLKFPSLKEMDIDSCPKMERFSLGSLTCDISKGKQTLREVVEDQRKKGEIEEEDVGMPEEQPIYLSLSIWDQFPIDNFIGLKKLRITGYDKISCLFSTSVAGNLINLKDLTIESCKNLVKVIKDKIDESHETSLLFPHLKELSLDELPKLKFFCEWRCALKLPLLEKMRIHSCPQIERFSLGSLTTPELNIINIDPDHITIAGDLNDVLQQRFSKLKEEPTST